jgi:hypothetical protein
VGSVAADRRFIAFHAEFLKARKAKAVKFFSVKCQRDYLVDRMYKKGCLEGEDFLAYLGRSPKDSGRDHLSTIVVTLVKS